MKKLAICMPCFGRPDRTIRAIESIMSQTVHNWEAFIIGDCCPDFQKMLDKKEDLLSIWKGRANLQGNLLHFINMGIHKGGYGYAIRNFANKANRAEYILYLDNDDMLDTNHFENYLAGIQDTDNDFVFFNTNMQFVQYGSMPQTDSLKFESRIRDAQAEYGRIGHAEIIVKSKFLKDHPEIKETAEYGHDWKFIKQMIDAGAKYEKAANPAATYNIMGAGELREAGID